MLMTIIISLPYLKKHLEQNAKLEQTKGWNDGTFDPLL